MSKTCKVIYLLNEEGRKASLLGNGDGKRIQIINAPISKELLGLANVDKEGNITVKIGFTKDPNETSDTFNGIKIGTKIGSSWNGPVIEDITKIKEFDTPQTIDSLLDFDDTRKRDYEKSLNENKEQIKDVLLKYQEEKRIKEEEKRIKEEEKRIKEEEEKRRKEADRKDDIEWINAKGSDYLKQCVRLGYDCRRKYIQERAKVEFPDFYLDFDDKAGWKERVSPSQQALDEVYKWIDKGHEDAKIVWLTESIFGCEYDYENDFEPCEAITFKFKGYDLIKEI